MEILHDSTAVYKKSVKHLVNKKACTYLSGNYLSLIKIPPFCPITDGLLKFNIFLLIDKIVGLQCNCSLW